jgi:hypothetical protein
VAYTCDPSYTGGIDRRTVVQGWPGQKCKTVFEKSPKQKRVEEYMPTTREALPSNYTTAPPPTPNFFLEKERKSIMKSLGGILEMDQSSLF